MTREQIKQWVAIHSTVQNPYGKYYTASTTLGYDIYGEGETIEAAYNDLTDIIFNSSTCSKILKERTSFKVLNP